MSLAATMHWGPSEIEGMALEDLAWWIEAVADHQREVAKAQERVSRDARSGAGAPR